MAEPRCALLAAFSLLIGTADNASARVQDYQIVRLLTFKSECHLDQLIERPAEAGRLRFHATCENVSFYPDGVDVTCDDRDDDRSCRVVTPPRSFESLDLLNRR